MAQLVVSRDHLLLGRGDQGWGTGGNRGPELVDGGGAQRSNQGRTGVTVGPCPGKYRGSDLLHSSHVLRVMGIEIVGQRSWTQRSWA